MLAAKGEVRFTIGPADYLYVLDFRAQRAIETKFAKPFAQVLSDMDELMLDDLAFIFWAGLQRHHPDVLEDHVEAMFDAIGTNVVMTTIGASVRLAFGVPEDPQAARPRKARGRAGT